MEWSDNRKYITFTDEVRQAQGDTKCKIRNNKLEKYYNIDFSKEELERGFEVNARRNKTIEEARKQLSRTASGSIQQDTSVGRTSADTLIRELNARERVADEKRKARENERKRLDRERKREAEASKSKSKTRQSQSRGRER